MKFKGYESQLRYLLGDVRNFDRVKRAMSGIDYVFNAAAIKHVPIAEYNPMEAVTVNIIGLDNIIEAAFIQNVQKIIHISTDKAVTPTTVMGCTKMLGERLCISRNWAKGSSTMNISCVRFGNVLGSRGSIIPLIKSQIEQGNEVTLTGAKMKRFFMSLSQAVQLVLRAMMISLGSEIFVLKMPTVLIKDLISVIIEEYAIKIGKDPKNIKIKDIGPRIGEKFDEDLLSPIEYDYCFEMDDMYVIFPSSDFGGLPTDLKSMGNLRKIEETENFIYSTSTQTPLSKEEIRKTLLELNLLN